MRENALFAGLTDKELAVIGQIALEKQIPKGTPLFVEHMLGETTYIIKTGSVKVTKTIKGIGEKSLLHMKAGDFFGELALLDGGQRLTSAVALEDSELLMIQESDFRKLLVAEPALCLKVLTNLIRIFTKRLRKNDELFHEFFVWQLTQR